MLTQFENSFGRVSFNPISETMHVSKIHGADLDPRCMFDLETAEKIALITENCRAQLGHYKTAGGWRCYIVLHEDASTAAVAEIKSLTYIGGTPALELEAARRFDQPMERAA